MLEMVDLGKEISPEDFKKKMPDLERRLNELQRELKDAGIPTIVVFEGLEAAGKGTIINRLMLPLDPRGFKVHPIHTPTEEEYLRPFLIRFWNKLPGRGRVGIFDRSWYTRVLKGRVEKMVPKKIWRQAFEDIITFERQQSDDGAVIIKFWIHITQKEQKKRFKKISNDPSLCWKIGKEEWRQHKQYDKYIKAAEETFEKTNTAYAPWVVIESHDKRFARLKVFETLVSAWEKALSEYKQKHRTVQALAVTATTAPDATIETDPLVEKTKEKEQVLLSAKSLTVLSALDLTQKLTREEYDPQIDECMDKLRVLEHEIFMKRIPVVVAFEGCDAAGKGGAIKRLSQNLDPRGYEVMPIAAPNREELDHHYLWRFARAIPKAGHITIFDRTWYGRVLVERVEGFCSAEAWQRAYREINEFEAHLSNYGAVLVKFWLHIDQAEQLRRFKERQDTTWKQWKITDEDWRNREKWPQYETAINDMLVNCSTSYAPWTIVEANDKLFARLKILKTVIAAIEKHL